MDFLLFVTRILFCGIFLSSAFGHLSNTEQMGEYAASKNVPLPKASVFISGLMLLFGGLSILLGIWVNIGAVLLIIFLIPAAFMMHNFWEVDDPMERQNEQIHFWKDLALAGGSYFIWYIYSHFEYVPWSLENYF